MERVAWPTLHTGFTPADIPIGYSAFTTIWDDHRGYEPKVVGHEVDDAGRTVIMVAISPGAVISITLVNAGQTLGGGGTAVLEALGAIRAEEAGVEGRPSTISSVGPSTVQDHREERS